MLQSATTVRVEAEMPVVNPPREGRINQRLLIRDHTLPSSAGNQPPPHSHLSLHTMQGTR